MEKNRAQLSHPENEAAPTNLPALLGGTPVFEKTSDVPFPKLTLISKIIPSSRIKRQIPEPMHLAPRNLIIHILPNLLIRTLVSHFGLMLSYLL